MISRFILCSLLASIALLTVLSAAMAQDAGASQSPSPSSHPSQEATDEPVKSPPSDEAIQQVLSGDTNPVFVKSQKVASVIAEAVLSEIYGQEEIAEQLPLITKLEEGIWIVTGTFHREKYMDEMKQSIKNPQAHFSSSGGVAEIRIAQKSGCIISINHGE